MNVLNFLCTSVMQEINLRRESMVMELAKVTNNKAELQIEYNKVMMEWDESKQK
jgi:hypothetical protein